MNISKVFRQLLSLALVLSLSLPAAVFADGKPDTKKGKKNYSEGLKYEQEEKWDLAAQAYFLAVAADPTSAEYRLHLVKASQNASQMFMKRGQAFEAEGDYASAYTAYKTAINYDQSNEVASVKMKRMIEAQKAQAGMGDAPKYNTSTGNIIPTSADIAPAQKYQSRSKDVAGTITYKDTQLRLVILTIAKQLGLNVIFDETFRDNAKFSMELQNTTLARALDFIFIQNKLTFEQLDRRTILVYLDNPNNRQRFERLMVKTFYVSNTKLEDARQVVQTMLQGGGGLNRQVAMSPQLNALIVRAPAEDLRMVQEVLESIDKNKAEVSIDVDIYEVSHNASQQIGNQIATDPSTVNYNAGYTTQGIPITRQGTAPGLSNLGGFFGQNILSGLVGTALTSGSAVGALVAAPPTALSMLQSKTNAKQVSRLNVHALDGQANKTNVGRRVPVNLGFALPSVSTGTTTGTGTTGSALGSFGYSSYQYQDVGLNIDITPTITNEGYIEMKMTIESSNTVPGTGGTTQTPEFTQRKLTTVSRILDGRTSIVAGIQQSDKQDGRTSIPVVGMVPFLGRFFSAPKESNNLSDIVITVTPHIIRAPQIELKDHKAKESGTGLGGNFVSIEQVVMRAQDEDDYDRRIIAARQGAAPPDNSASNTEVKQVDLTPPIPRNASFTNSAAAPIRANNPNGEQAQNAITDENAAEEVPNPDEPGPGFKEGPKAFGSTPEQRKAMEEYQKSLKSGQPGQATGTPGANGSRTTAPATQGSEPIPGYTPQLVPVKPQVKKEEKPSTEGQPQQQDLSLNVKGAAAVAEVTGSDIPVGMSLKVGEKKPQIGDSFIVVLSVDGKSKMTGANIALDYNSSVLQLKSVRDAGLLGANPDMTRLDNDGKLLVTLQQNSDLAGPVNASGKLLILEFKALKAGQAMIALNNEGTRYLLGQKENRLSSSTPANLEIIPASFTKLSK